MTTDDGGLFHCIETYVSDFCPEVGPLNCGNAGRQLWKCPVCDRGHLCSVHRAEHEAECKMTIAGFPVEFTEPMIDPASISPPILFGMYGKKRVPVVWESCSIVPIETDDPNVFAWQLTARLRMK